MTDNIKLKNIFTKTLFLIGIIIIILVLAFAVIKIIPKIFTIFDGNDLNQSKNELVLEVEDKSINSNQTTLIEWDYEPDQNGIYEFKYKCADYLTLELGTSAGNKKVECDTVYQLNPTTQTISILPTLDRENILVDLPISINYINRSGEIITSDDVQLTVVNKSAEDLAGSATIIDAEVINPAPVNRQDTDQSYDYPTDSSTDSSASPVDNTPVYSGKADLNVSNLRSINDVTVIFDISNIGSRPSPNWVFNYRMPDGDVETSPLQNALRPGEVIRYTLRFEDIPQGEVVIAVDPADLINEMSELNNIAIIEVDGDDGYYDDYYDDRYDEADLIIEDLEVGRLRGSRFIEDDNIDEDDNAAIRFVVKNTGGESTGSWRFEVDNTPYDDDDEYESRRQTSLRPGESKIITVEFENPDEGRYRISVEVDSRDDVDEEDERNNREYEYLRIRD